MFEGAVLAGIHITNTALQCFMTQFFMQKHKLVPLECGMFAQLGSTFIVHLYDAGIFKPESISNSTAIKVRVQPYKVLLTCISIWSRGERLELLNKAFKILDQNIDLLKESDEMGLFVVAK